MLRDRPREFLYAEESALVNQHPEAAMRSLSGHRPMGVNTVSYFGNSPGKGHELWTGEKFDNSVPGGAQAFPQKDSDLWIATDMADIYSYSQSMQNKDAKIIADYINASVKNGSVDPTVGEDLVNTLKTLAGRKDSDARQMLLNWEQAYANIYNNKGNGDLTNTAKIWSNWAQAYGTLNTGPQPSVLLDQWCQEVQNNNGAYMNSNWLAGLPASSTWTALQDGWNDWAHAHDNFVALAADSKGILYLDAIGKNMLEINPYPVVFDINGTQYQPGINENVSNTNITADGTAKVGENMTQAMSVAQVNNAYAMLFGARGGTPVVPSPLTPAYYPYQPLTPATSTPSNVSTYLEYAAIAAVGAALVWYLRS